MKIRTQLVVVMVLFGVVLAIISASVLHTEREVESLRAHDELARNLEVKASDTGFLSLRERVDRLRQRNLVLILVLLGLFAAYFAANHLLVHRRTLGALAELKAGAEVVGSGDLDFAVAVKRNDGVGELGRACNQMTADLKKVIASKAELEKEMGERRQAEEELHELAQRLDSHMENSPLAVIEWSSDYRVTRWAGGAQRIFGWAPDEIVGRRIDEIRWVHEEDVDKVDRLIEGTLAGAHPRSVNANRNYRKDGSIIWCEWYNSVLKDDSGNLSSVLSLVLDVTEREEAMHRAAEARADAERTAAELNSFMDNVGEGMSLIDAAGRMLWMNRAGRALFGAQEVEDFSDWVSSFQRLHLNGEPVPLEETVAFRSLRGEAVRDFRYKAVTPGGKEVFLSANASPLLDGEGRIIGATHVFREIGEELERAREREALFAREHRIADMLQQALIPSQGVFRFPGCEVAAKYRAALREAQVGGDFYDAFSLEDGKVGVLIGDVAGKGLRAAIRVSAARYAIRSYAYLDPRPARVITLANDALVREDRETGGMLTALFAVVDTTVGLITYCCAGHEPPVLRRADGALVTLATGGPAMGIIEGATYRDSSERLERSDLVVMVTDGVTEARTGTTGLFGNAGIREYLAGEGRRSVEEVAGGLLEAATGHAGGVLRDDVAILVLTLSGNGDA